MVALDRLDVARGWAAGKDSICGLAVPQFLDSDLASGWVSVSCEEEGLVHELVVARCSQSVHVATDALGEQQCASVRKNQVHQSSHEKRRIIVAVSPFDVVQLLRYEP